MSKRATNHLHVVTTPVESETPFVQGVLDHVTDDGRVVARLPDGTKTIITLGTTLSDQLILEAVRARRSVLLARLGGAEGDTPGHNPGGTVGARWVLICTLRDRIGLVAARQPTEESAQSAASVDGHVEIEGEEGITLGCGEATIELRADGRIALRGRDILVTSTGNTTVQGAVVKVN